MRSSKSRSRSKSNRNNNRSSVNIVNRVFDSSGPEGKVRGTPQQIIDKYNQLARDAQLSNDRVAAENFMQHSEHYTRMLGEAQREIDMRREQEQQSQRDRQQNAQNPQSPNNGHQGGQGQPGHQGNGPSHGSHQGSDGGSNAAQGQSRDDRQTDPSNADQPGFDSSRRDDDAPASAGGENRSAVEPPEKGEKKGPQPRKRAQPRRSRAESQPPRDDVIDTRDAGSDDQSGGLVDTPENKPAPKPRRSRAKPKPKAEDGNGSDNGGSGSGPASEAAE